MIFWWMAENLGENIRKNKRMKNGRNIKNKFKVIKLFLYIFLTHFNIFDIKIK